MSSVSDATPAGITYRTDPLVRDLASLRELVDTIDIFYPEERGVAVELLEERLRLGPASGYSFVFADQGERLAGYTAWGPIPMTKSSFDLYWIAVRPELQGLGIGRELMQRTEAEVAALGGGRIYVETSSRDVYRATREFYVRAGYPEVARFDHFYAQDDAKVVYCRVVSGSPARTA
jgi:GNAT superfamily N-acetyltransferase